MNPSEQNEKIWTVTEIIETLLNRNKELVSQNEVLTSENQRLKILVESVIGKTIDENPILLPLEEIINFMPTI
jgi:hypothetical protein